MTSVFESNWAAQAADRLLSVLLGPHKYRWSMIRKSFTDRLNKRFKITHETVNRVWPFWLRPLPLMTHMRIALSKPKLRIRAFDYEAIIGMPLKCGSKKRDCYEMCGRFTSFTGIFVDSQTPLGHRLPAAVAAQPTLVKLVRATGGWVGYVAKQLNQWPQ